MEPVRIPLVNPTQYHSNIPPLAGSQLHQVTFPIPAPLGAATVGRLSQTPNTAPSIAVRPMFKMPCSPGISRTKIASMVKDLPMKNRLHTVRVSRQLWSNLVAYATATPENADQRGTFTVNQANASALDQIKSVFAIHGWYQRQQLATDHIVNSEADIQDALYSDLFQYVNDCLKVTYFIKFFIYFSADYQSTGSVPEQDTKGRHSLATRRDFGCGTG